MARMGQVFQNFLVPFKSVRLKIRLAIPMKSVPFQCMKNGINAPRDYARRVYIINAQFPHPTSGLGIQPRAHRGND